MIKKYFAKFKRSKFRKTIEILITKVIKRFYLKSIENELKANNFDNFKEVVEIRDIEKVFNNIPENLYYLKTSKYYLPIPYNIKLKNVYFSPSNGLIYDNDKKIIIESIYGFSNQDIVPPYIYRNISLFAFRKKQVISIDEPGFVYNNYTDNYFHKLTGPIPRLFLMNLIGKSNKINLYVSQKLNSIDIFFLSTLVPMDIKIVKLNPSKIYQFESLFFLSSLMRRNAPFLPTVYLDFLHKKLFTDFERTKNKKIFISRRKIYESDRQVDCRHIKNEHIILNKLKKMGFEECFLEELPITEQAKLFYNAKIIVGVHGAGFTNMMFSKNATIIEIMPASKFGNRNLFYYCLARSKYLNLTHMFFTDCDTDKNFNLINLEEKKFFNLIENILR